MLKMLSAEFLSDTVQSIRYFASMVLLYIVIYIILIVIYSSILLHFILISQNQKRIRVSEQQIGESFEGIEILIILINQILIISRSFYIHFSYSLSNLRDTFNIYIYRSQKVQNYQIVYKQYIVDRSQKVQKLLVYLCADKIYKQYIVDFICTQFFYLYKSQYKQKYAICIQNLQYIQVLYTNNFSISPSLFIKSSMHMHGINMNFSTTYKDHSQYCGLTYV
eukprot:TRINITY_DN3001_c0_g2_i8.p1 TRINITY_DN3001_c0_g2~~TRINITY_DN3001_c0_g2_i8.p1  ORF type:complete len:222 (+),score=-27.53 TRINITY_DN3001_c0_g2_i8:573-1238(+)